MTLTHRDADLLLTVGGRVSLMTLEQVRRGWWPEASSAAACARRVRRLVKLGLLARTVVVAAPPSELNEPLVRWWPGRPLPDFQPVLREARRRGRAPLRTYAVIGATVAGAARSGATVRPVRASDAAHDLLLAEVFLCVRRQKPEWVRFWRADGRERSRASERAADAVVALPGRPLHLEVVGCSYTRTKLLLVHRYCEARGQEYQLW